MKGKILELPVYFDIEDNSLTVLGKTALTNLCISYNTIIEEAGFYAGVYANRNWFDNYLDKSIIRNKYTTWIAHYGLAGTEQYKGVYDMWQNSENGKINGITGKVDTNYLYRNLMAEIGNKEVPGVKGGDEELKVYQNGSTTEDVYSDTDCTIKIGSLNVKEKCDCLGIFNNRAIVRYKVNGSNNYKIGFVKWLGGVK